MNRLQEIEERMLAIEKELDNEKADIPTLRKEFEDLKEEKRTLLEKSEQRKSLLSDIANGKGTVIENHEERKENEKMEREDILNSKEYRSAFFKTLLGKDLNETEKRAYTDATGSAAAALPTETQNVLFQKMVKLAPMLSEITLLRVAGNVTFAVEGTRADGYLHTQNATITETTDTIVAVSLTGYEYNKLVSISKTVQTMAIGAFEGWLVDMLAEDIARLIENAIINGTGSSQPQGTAAAKTWTTLNSISCTTAITYDNVMDLIALLPAAYDSEAKFLCNKKMVYGALAKIKDDQKNPILVKDMENGLSFRIMGYPLIISDKVVDDELYFGSYKKIVGNLAQDVTVESSLHSGFATNSIQYRGGAIFDCKVALPEAITRFKKNS
jgi:HK97 family phage major capsid protein